MEELNRQFRTACYEGNLEQAQQLLNKNPDINISSNDDYAFRGVCYYGHLEVAQWLLQVKPDIDISAKEDVVFRLACYNGRLVVAQWLVDLKPERYEITEVTSNARGKHKIQYKIYENNDKPMDYILK